LPDRRRAARAERQRGYAGDLDETVRRGPSLLQRAGPQGRGAGTGAGPHVAAARVSMGGGMIITIDGPAGTGKSTVAQAVADRLGYDFLDTGAMYRAIGLEALRRRANLDDPRELAFIAEHCRIEFDYST